MDILVPSPSPSTTSLIHRSLPQEIRATQAKASVIIDFAAKVKDWPLLEDAIDAKIEDQAAFVAWWDQTVRRPGGDKRSDTIVSRPDSMTCSDSLEASTGIKKMQVSRWRKHLADKPQYRERMILAAYRKADLAPTDNHRAEGTGNNDWFTPPQYLDAAREVMGGIDLDPATHLTAQKVVQASTFYTKEDDGLSKEWHGRVWLNPPVRPAAYQPVQREDGGGIHCQACDRRHHVNAQLHRHWMVPHR